MSFTQRVRPSMVAWLVASLAAVAIGGVLLLLPAASAAKSSASAAAAKSPVAASRQAPTGRAVQKCERLAKVCNKVAWSRLPLRTPDSSDAALMTEAQAIGEAGWTEGMSVGAVQMTYGQANSAYPELAAEDFIDSARAVWIVTVYYPQAVTSVNFGPPRAGGTTYSAVTVIIDAATGDETDWCTGCSMITASAAAARTAAASNR